jgi:hypothetical protein
MKKKVLTIVMVVAGIVSIGGIGFALSANQLTDKTSSNNDIMYAQVKTPETSLATAKDTSLVTVENNSRPTSNDQDLTIDEVDVERNNNTDNTNKAKNRDLVLNKVSRSNPSSQRSDSNVSQNKVASSQPLASNSQPDTNKDKNSSTSLSKEDALNVLKEKNNKLDYNYMGDEESYSVLKEKGHEGYVFLPDAQTDMGMFVDKNTKEVYYFHPSGYMDIY